MHTIQEMAQMCGTTAKTLRFYDKMGIFCPDYTDPENGYRYYTDRQLHKYRLIEEYKRMGFTLSEIRRLMSHSGEVDVPEMVRLKKAELQEAIAACDERLEELERWKQPTQEKTVVERDDAENRIVVRCGDLTRSIYAEPDEMQFCFDTVEGLFVFSGLSADDFPNPEYRVVFTRTADMTEKKSADLSALSPSEEEYRETEFVLIMVQAGPLVDIAAWDSICTRLSGYFREDVSVLYNMNLYGAEWENLHINMIGLCAV
ncbi:MAG: MerR family transcriptional regulator [Clostridia bacterium]|nr:MerR family transcriptional regulator [Clostridia bacterium]